MPEFNKGDIVEIDTSVHCYGRCTSFPVDGYVGYIVGKQKEEVFWTWTANNLELGYTYYIFVPEVGNKEHPQGYWPVNQNCIKAIQLSEKQKEEIIEKVRLHKQVLSLRKVVFGKKKT